MNIERIILTAIVCSTIAAVVLKTPEITLLIGASILIALIIWFIEWHMGGR